MIHKNQDAHSWFMETYCSNRSGWKVKNGYGMEDYYKFYKKECIDENKKPLSYSNFSKLIWRINEKIRFKIVDRGENIPFPYGLGTIKLKKIKPILELDKDGNLITSYPVDLDSTIKLWYENPEAKDKKLLVRHLNKHSNGYYFKLMWVKYNAKFKNATFYRFKINRQLKRALSVSIQNGQIDAVLSKNYNG